MILTTQISRTGLNKFIHKIPELRIMRNWRWIPYSRDKIESVYQVLYSLTGNPVKIGSGTAAVTSPFQF